MVYPVARHSLRGPGGKFAPAPRESADSRVREAKGRQGHSTEEHEETTRFDLGPWAESPASSRVAAYRYDYLNQAIQVTWRNQKNHGYIYEDRNYETFRSFARAVSKGKYINLLGPPYRLMDPDEVQAPSNDRRTGIQSRVRG